MTTETGKQHAIRRIYDCTTKHQLEHYWMQVLGKSYQRNAEVEAAKNKRKAQLGGVPA
jgi:hypothetical protein